MSRRVPKNILRSQAPQALGWLASRMYQESVYVDVLNGSTAHAFCLTQCQACSDDRCGRPHKMVTCCA